jgi:hypothetical protein
MSRSGRELDPPEPDPGPAVKNFGLAATFKTGYIDRVYLGHSPHFRLTAHRRPSKS